MGEIDQNLFNDCERARRDLQMAESAVCEARSSFEGAVRRLYIEGASTREIADALGLSHQRVHQLIGAAPKSWWQHLLGVRQEPPRGCSFCGRVAKLVAGPSVHICDGCIAQAERALGQGGEEEKLARLPDGSRKRCSFCGQRDRRQPRATAGGHQICSLCAAKAQEIVMQASGADG